MNVVTPELLTEWADKIDHRVGPISGRDADRIAVILRLSATAIAGIRHPTGSEQFAAELDRLGIPAPWSLCDEVVGEVLAANRAIACQALDCLAPSDLDERGTQVALWIICAINTLAGYKAEVIDGCTSCI